MPEELADRLASVEARLDVVEALRALGSTDLESVEAKTNANTRLLKALAEVQSEHTRTLTEHTRLLERLGEGQAAIVGLLEELIRRDDDRRLGDDGVGE